MLMTVAETGNSVYTCHYTIRCQSITGLVAKISIQDLLRKIKSPQSGEMIQNFEFIMKHKAQLVQKHLQQRKEWSLIYVDEFKAFYCKLFMVPLVED